MPNIGYKVECFCQNVYELMGIGWQTVGLCDTMEQAKIVEAKYMDKVKKEHDDYPCYSDGEPIPMPTTRIRTVTVENIGMII